MCRYVFAVTLERDGHQISLEIAAASCSEASIISEAMAEASTGARYSAIEVARITHLH